MNTGEKGITAAPARRLALITGASSGIGEAFARLYAARGADVALVARRRDRLEALAAELKAAFKIEALVIPADLSRAEAADTVMAGLSASGRVADVLVNNAGFSVPKTFAATDWPAQRDFIATLVTAPCALAHAMIPGMIARGYGRIINIASIAAFSPGAPGHTLYPAAKSFMIKFSQSLDAELRGRGILVTALCPGFVQTGFHAANGTAAQLEQAPRLFWQSAEEVAATGIAANEAGRVVVVPGLHNKIAAALLQALPTAVTGPLIRKGAKKYQVPDQ